jgi:hypothetical protein
MNARRPFGNRVIIMEIPKWWNLDKEANFIQHFLWKMELEKIFLSIGQSTQLTITAFFFFNSKKSHEVKLY